MRPFVLKGLFLLMVAAISFRAGFASPLSNRLLSLVPPGVQVVAGFENGPGSNAHGRLLLTTHNNRLDLDDWQALSGVDSKRIVDEVIEVADSGTAPGLSEHMLLVAGRFDRERIFRSLELNGAQATESLGQPLLVVRPFTRERGEMLDVRWLAILDNHIGIFGTPGLVHQAIRRYVDHCVPDSVLEERLALLRRDVTSWNVLTGSSDRAKNIVFAAPHTAWTQLQQDADVLMVGTRFGTKIRVDLSIYTATQREADFFTQKAAVFTAALAPYPGSGSPPTMLAQRRLASVSLQRDRVQASMELSSKEFAAWCAYLLRVQNPSLQALTRGD